MKLKATLTPVQTLNGSLNSVGSLSARLTVPQKITSDDRYEGDYEVTPDKDDMTLRTKKLVMSDDLTVKAVPAYRVSNSKGITFIIG